MIPFFERRIFMDGLNRKDIEYRVNNGLVNNEDIKNSRTLKEIILTNTITLFNFIHLVLFALVLTTGSIENATFVVSILFNTIIGIYQEIKAKIIVDKLKIVSTDKVTVIRDGKKEEILPTEIVLDDLLYLKAGDNLAVDARLIHSDNLEVDESIITGESDVILKKENDKLISGSIITAGDGYAKVVSINRDTYANKLIKEASKEVDDSSYLMKNINTILKVVTVLIIPVGILLFITQFFYSNQTYSESILASVAGIIGMIPDGLVLLTSISLTVGVIKMASKKVIIQRLSGIELLACVDTLCLDKTGTITDGSMEVKDVIYLDNDKDKINNFAGKSIINDKVIKKDVLEEDNITGNKNKKRIGFAMCGSYCTYSRVFEEAYFILRESPDRPDSSDLAEEARKIIASNVLSPENAFSGKTKRSRTRLFCLISFAAGVIAGAAGAAIVFLVF